MTGGALAAGAALGRVEAFNDFAEDQAKKCAGNAGAVCKDCATTAKCGQHAVATAGLGVAKAVTLGKVDGVNQALEHQARMTAETSGPLVQTLDGMSSGTPVVGHVRGIVHYATGGEDGKERGEQCLKDANHSTGAIIGGTAGFFMGGAAGAIAGGIAGAQAVDGLTTGVEKAMGREFCPNGAVQAMGKAIAEGDHVDDAIIDAVVQVGFDALAGLCAGEAMGTVHAESVGLTFDGEAKAFAEAAAEEVLPGQEDLLGFGSDTDTELPPPLFTLRVPGFPEPVGHPLHRFIAWRWMFNNGSAYGPAFQE